METFTSHRKRPRSRGFGLIEAMIAIFILAFGLLALAGVMAQLSQGGTRSRYMSTEAVLASEKLDDLNRFPALDPAIAVPNGISAGSLDTDITQTVGALNTTVDYFDTVQISSGNGAMQETIKQTDGAGNLVYTTTTHAPDGTVTTTNTAAAPQAASDMVTYHRRWIIENNVPVAGARRITVAVLQDNGSPRAQFQSSLVRQ